MRRDVEAGFDLAGAKKDDVFERHGDRLDVSKGACRNARNDGTSGKKPDPDNS